MDPTRLDRETLPLLGEALARLDEAFRDLSGLDRTIDLDRLREVLLEVAHRMGDNYPYFHPLYAGQMLKPPHPVARLAYALSMWINPNNHALDGGRASSAMEGEAVREIAGMFGWEDPLGHLCGGGTMANLEGLWVSGKMREGMAVVASDQAHYTHRRITEVLRLPFQEVASDPEARMDLGALQKVLKGGKVGTVVVTMGSTGTGSVDPLADVLELRDRYGFRVHADAAYGGYFVLADNLGEETRRHFDRLGDVDSIAIDPHKHGLQPYGCGCILFRDPGVGALYRHDSPYTYFSSGELHLGEISLECSRAGASAVALWATQRMLPLVRGGEFSRDLGRCIEAARELHRRLDGDDRFRVMFPPELDIVVWTVEGVPSRSVFEACARKGLHLAVATLGGEERLRSCLMKPDHLDWLDRIWGILEESI